VKLTYRPEITLRKLNCKISILNNKHIKKISKIHQEELDVGALDLFGIKFLVNIYHELLKENFGLVAESGDEIIGFITATKKDISYIKCLSSISFITFIFNTFKKFKKFISFLILFNEVYIKKSWNMKSVTSSKSIELFSIAIKKKYQGQGVGKKLIEALEQKVKDDGSDEIFTRTHNVKLLNFYYRTKKAKLLKRIVLQNYNLNIVKWEI